MKQNRQANIELLRIVAMVMIVVLHYLGKGGALIEPTQGLTATGYVAWLVEAFCLVAVNVYVLISGYFGMNQSFSLVRVLRVWRPVLFYSISIGIVCLLLGVQQFDIYMVFTYLFPTVTQHYWFVTAFLVLSVLMPFLQEGVKQLEQKTFLCILGLLLLFCSISKSVLPMQLPWDQAGYDVLWFICLYLTGLYLQKYGLPWLQGKAWKGLLVYVIGSMLTFLSMVVFMVLYQKTGSFEAMVHYAYTYNHVLCYIAAIGLFVAFDSLPHELGKITPVIIKASGATFGVYLIHEHMNLRYLWPKWFACEQYANADVVRFVVHMVCSVLCVYFVCTGIELLRQEICKRVFGRINRES